MATNDETYENALRAAREVWEPDSSDFARRECLERFSQYKTTSSRFIELGWKELLKRCEEVPAGFEGLL